jgi:hypothetical protein
MEFSRQTHRRIPRADRECRTFPTFTDHALGFSDYIELQIEVYIELYFEPYIELSTIRSDPRIKIVPHAYALVSGFSGLGTGTTSGLVSALISVLASGLV